MTLTAPDPDDAGFFFLLFFFKGKLNMKRSAADQKPGRCSVSACKELKGSKKKRKRKRAVLVFFFS